jgi:hypothetical protein
MALEPLAVPRVRPPAKRGPSARQALEASVLKALVAGHGSVSFSGGRDSSLVLAIACHVARREGLPLPAAITMRHPSRESAESAWQERVISHLGVTDWLKVDVGDSMDALGPDASRVLLSHGLLAPANAYLHLPVVQLAPRGTLLTGVGGDEVLGTPGERLARLVWHHDRPKPRDVLRMGLAMAPRAVRRRVKGRSGFPWAPWLTPQAARQVSERHASQLTRTRLRWDVAAMYFAQSRSVQLGKRALSVVGADSGVKVATPLMDPTFIEAFARQVGPGGPADRATSMRMLASDLLPLDVLQRTTKATFDAMIWGPRVRAFLAEWRPENMSIAMGDLVDVDELTRQWGSDQPYYLSLMLLQQAWLQTVGRSGTRRVLQ